MKMQKLLSLLPFSRAPPPPNPDPPQPQPQQQQQLYLFGGPAPWSDNVTSWRAVDDRVRGGSSQSYLTPVANTSYYVSFHGTLDTKTLGGAGFASQTTTGERMWDLSAYDGFQVEFGDPAGGGGVVGAGKGGAEREEEPKVFTFVVKDDLDRKMGESSSRREDGRERAGINWEFDFGLGDGEPDGLGGRAVWVPWGELTPMYRGRERKDVERLRTGEVKGLSLMMRSFFEKQEGRFELEVRSISALRVEQGEESQL